MTTQAATVIDALALAQLIARVEAATGPSRHLDGAIECSVRWIEAARAGLEPRNRAVWRPMAGLPGAVESDGTRYAAEGYTASLDAALALVERVLPGWQCSAIYVPPDLSEGHVWERGHTGSIQGKAATPALALILAMLRALAALAETPG